MTKRLGGREHGLGHLWTICLGIAVWPAAGCGPQQSSTDRIPPEAMKVLDAQLRESEADTAVPRGSRPELATGPGLASTRGLPGPPAAEPAVRPYSQWGLQETVADALGASASQLFQRCWACCSTPTPSGGSRRPTSWRRSGRRRTRPSPDWSRRLEDPDQRVRKAAARALGQIGAGAADAVGPLLETLEESSTTEQPP